MREKDVEIILRGLDEYIEDYHGAISDGEKGRAARIDIAAFEMIDDACRLCRWDEKKRERFRRHYIDGTQGIPVVNLNTE